MAVLRGGVLNIVVAEMTVVTAPFKLCVTVTVVVYPDTDTEDSTAVVVPAGTA